MDLSGVVWICGGSDAVADEVGERLGAAVRHVEVLGYSAFRTLLHGLQALDEQRLVVAGDLPLPGVAAAGGRAVLLGEDRDAHVLRIPCLPADASADDVIAAIGTSP